MNEHWLVRSHDMALLLFPDGISLPIVRNGLDQNTFPVGNLQLAVKTVFAKISHSFSDNTSPEQRF